MMVWLFFILIALGAGAVSNKLFKSGVVACMVAGVVSTIVFQLIVAIQIGHLDKFALIAVIVTFPVGILISGVEILVWRKIEGSQDSRA